MKLILDEIDMTMSPDAGNCESPTTTIFDAANYVLKDIPRTKEYMTSKF